MRQEQTKKVVANFMLEEAPLCNLQSHGGSDRAFLWIAHDYSEGEGTREKFAVRFGNPEAATAFKEAFNAGKEFNAAKKAGKEATEAPIVEA